MKKKKPIKLNPSQKGATRKRVGVSKKTGKIPAEKLDKAIVKEKKAVAAAKPGSAKRKAAVKRLRQDTFAKTFGKKKREKINTFKSQEWIVAFFNRGSGFFNRFVSRESSYQHVALFCRRELGWYCFSPYSNYWTFEELPVMAHTEFKSRMFIMQNCFAWMRVIVDNPGCKTHPFIIPNCVSVVKHLMGIDIGFSLTVKQFFNQLQKHDEGANYRVVERRRK